MVTVLAPVLEAASLPHVCPIALGYGLPPCINNKDLMLDMPLHAGTWTPTGSMAVIRGQHSMASLPNGNAISAGGYNGSSELASTELYTASTGQWSLVAPMSTARVYFDLLSLTDGKVLAAGGQNASFLPIASSELFDPATSKWSITGSLPVAQEVYGSIVLPNGTAFITGESSSHHCQNHKLSLVVSF